MSESESIVAATASRIFSDFADPQTLNRAKDDAWRVPLWSALAEAGLTLAWTPGAQGGAGASLAEGFEIIGIAGRFAAPVPLAETLLASWLLSQAGIASPAGPMTVAPARPGAGVSIDAAGRLAGALRGVPFAPDAAHIAVLGDAPAGRRVVLVDKRHVLVGDGRNLAGDASSAVTFDGAPAVASAHAPDSLDATALLLMGATARSLAIAGALQATLAMSVQYANERVAFERPIGKFQAVQHNLARLAGEAAAAMTAATSAADAIAHAETFDDGIFLEAAAAKIRCAEAAQEGAAIAHQVFGALGFTKEHVLHRFTLRMLSWRDDFGNESHWAVELGNRIAARGADEFWPLVASR